MINKPISEAEAGFVEQKLELSYSSKCGHSYYYEESVVDKFKSNLLLMIIWLNIINYNS